MAFYFCATNKNSNVRGGYRKANEQVVLINKQSIMQIISNERMEETNGGMSAQQLCTAVGAAATYAAFDYVLKLSGWPGLVASVIGGLIMGEVCGSFEGATPIESDGVDAITYA